MENLIRIITIFFLFAVVRATVAGAQEVPVYRIDPSKAYGGSISDYFDETEYIPLETKPESLFGDIQQLFITDSSFIIRDADTKSILFFDSNGKFIRRIKPHRGFKPHVTYDDSNQIVKVVFLRSLDINIKKITVKFYNFSTTGNPIDTTEKEIVTGASFSTINLGAGYSFKTNSCAPEKGSIARDSVIYLIEIYKSSSLHKKLIPYNQKDKLGFCYFCRGMSESSDSYTIINGVTYAATPVENYVYKISKDSAVKICEIVFPKEAAVSKDILKLRDTKLLDSALRTPTPVGTIYSVADIFFKGNKLFFRGVANAYLSNISTSALQVYNFIYDTATHEVVALERLTPDASTFYLPAFDPKDGLMIKGLLYSRNNFYSYVSSLDMFSAKEATRSKNPQYPPVLQEYFKTQTRKSNPVIVRMKLKEQSAGGALP